jgi:hypothetical protein
MACVVRGMLQVEYYNKRVSQASQRNVVCYREIVWLRDCYDCNALLRSF